MPHILLSNIHIPENRQRQEFDPEALQELKNSIQDTGLLHPPVLRIHQDPSSGEIEWYLVAGERRLRAIKELFELGGSFRHDEDTYSADNGVIPFTSLGELNRLEAEEAELDENLKRRDLTWQELASAHARLHALRVEQKTVSDLVLGKHTVADTAKEIYGRSDGYFQEQTRKELIVSKHLENPEVAKAKNVDEAFKILKREEARQRNVDLAVEVGRSFNSSAHTVVNGECLAWMREAGNHGRFDVILTDPPYGMGAHGFGDGAGRMGGIEHHYDDSIESWRALMRSWCPLAYMCAKPQAHAYVFCDLDNFHELRQLMKDSGWYVFRTPLIVYKLNSGRVPLPSHGPRRQYETILYAIKGDKPVTHIYPDVIPCQGDQNLSHGAQKPVGLFENLLQRSVRPGDSVLDCFAGTGTIIPAAHTLKCAATAVELSQEYYGICLGRLKELDNVDPLGGLV